MGRPGRCHAWGCGDHSVPPSSLSCGEAWVWRGRCWQARGGTNWAVWTHPKRVRGWGRWGRETREAESGVKLFAAAAPGGSGPLPALLFLPAGQRAATVLSQLAASLSTWTRCDGSTRSRSGRFQPAHSPSAPDSPVLSCCNTPTAFYAPWTSSPCALPTPKGLETCGGRGGAGTPGEGPPGCLWPGQGGSGLGSFVCRCGSAQLQPGGRCFLSERWARWVLAWSCRAAWWKPTWVARGPQQAAQPGRHWVGFLVVSAKQACCPLPWSRVREVQAVGPHKQCG